MNFKKLTSSKIGIDMGTSNTRICLEDGAKGAMTGQIITEPSVVALNVSERDAAVVEVGAKAKEMIGRNPGSFVVMRPIKNGTIANFEVAASMLKIFIAKALNSKVFAKAKVEIAIPSSATDVERRNIHDVAVSAGAKYVSLVEQPFAAAVGAGIAVNRPNGNMVIDFGAGICDIAVISLGDTVTSRSILIGGDDMDRAIVEHIKREHGVLIGEHTAEEIKKLIGSAVPYEGEKGMNVRGRSQNDGLPKSIWVSAEEIRKAMRPLLDKFIETIRLLFEKTPPELHSDIAENGITLTGGSSLLRGLPELILKRTGVRAKIAKNPMDCVALGAKKLLLSND